MSAPLVVLAIATVLGGGIDFPFWNFDFLTRFLAPLFPTAEVITLSAGTKWALALGTLALALIGLGLRPARCGRRLTTPLSSPTSCAGRGISTTSSRPRSRGR